MFTLIRYVLAYLPDGSSCEMVGSSTGGGKILVTRVNGMAVKFTGQYPTLITRHQDRPGILASISGLLAQHSINIAFLKSFAQRGSQASMVMETDSAVSKEIIEKLSILRAYMKYC